MTPQEIILYAPPADRVELDDRVYVYSTVSRERGVFQLSIDGSESKEITYDELEPSLKGWLEKQAKKRKENELLVPAEIRTGAADHPYSVENRCLTCTSVTKNRDKSLEYTPIKLGNFCARIKRAITYDDGAEQRKYYEIDGALDNPTRAQLRLIVVPAASFPQMDWLAQWDGRAVLMVGPYIRDHARAAIQLLSNDRGYDVRHVYAHTGWRQIEGKWVYLHAGGGIGEDGLNADIDVEFKDTRLAVFNLPPPPEGNDLKEAVRDVIALLNDALVLDVIPTWVIYPEVAKIFRAPLNEVLPITTSDFLTGKTGSHKTAVHAVSQAFFGEGFDAGSLPGSWLSTENQLEKLLYVFKDAVCEIDDFKPQGSATQAQKAHTKADRVFRGHANKAGRGRMRPDGSFAPTYHSRAYLSASGEDVPIGQSLRGRMLIRELKDENINLEWLSEAQELAACGTYAKVMSAYLRWLAPQMNELKHSEELRELFLEKRNEYLEKLRHTAAHAQTPGALADLFIGFKMLIQFALDAGAIDTAEAAKHLETFERVLVTMGSYQGSFIRSEDPSTQFIDLIAALLSSGRAHLCDVPTNGVPTGNPTTCGWIEGRERTQTSEDGYATGITETWIAQGECVGWIDERIVYLQPNSAFAAAQKLARDQGTSIPYTKNTLYQRMSDKRLIAAHEDSRATKVKKVCGQSKRVLWIDAARVLGSDDDADEAFE
jgi:hypothetical protein